MKIQDYSSRKWFAPIFYICVFLSFLGGVIFQDRSLSEVLALAVILGLPMVGFIHFDFLDRRWYIVDETGITSVFLHGKIKIHFNWTQLVAAKMYHMKVKRYTPLECIIVLSFDDKYTLKDKHSYEWYFWRNKSIVIFKFDPDRYEYIRQFCNLPLIDNR